MTSNQRRQQLAQALWRLHAELGDAGRAGPERVGTVHLLLHSGDLELRECVVPQGAASHHTSPPHCNGARVCTPLNQGAARGGEALVGEWHTHPPGRRPGGFSPPSSDDMYQLLLACLVHRTHNRSAVLADEGTYVASVVHGAPFPAACLRELRRFIGRTVPLRRAVLVACRTPVVGRAEYPHLHRLLHGPKALWRRLVQKRTLPVAEKIRVFCAYALSSLGIRIDLIPPS